MNDITRYAIVDKDMIVARIEDGIPEGPTKPYTILVPSEDAQVGWFYDPRAMKFSIDRDPNAFASYQALIDHSEETIKKIRAFSSRRFREENKAYLQSLLDEVRKKILECREYRASYADTPTPCGDIGCK